MITRELPDFLKQGFPNPAHPELVEGPPPARPRPGRMAFPEMRPVAEPGLHDAASMGEWVVRDWAAHVDAGRFA